MRRRCAGRRAGQAACAVVFFVALLQLIGTAQALQFEMQTQTKCIYEEINANVIVVGDYQAANRDNPGLPIYVDVKVGVLWMGRWGCESLFSSSLTHTITPTPQHTTTTTNR